MGRRECPIVSRKTQPAGRIASRCTNEYVQDSRVWAEARWDALQGLWLHKLAWNVTACTVARVVLKATGAAPLAAPLAAPSMPTAQRNRLRNDTRGAQEDPLALRRPALSGTGTGTGTGTREAASGEW